MVVFLAFNSRISSMASDQNIPLSVQLQYVYSNSKECTEIPWESLTLMMISLALVEGIHQRWVIKWFLPCLKSRHLFTWIESYHLVLEWRTWMVRFSLEYVPIFTLQWIIVWSHYMDPNCMSGGYVQVLSQDDMDLLCMFCRCVSIWFLLIMDLQCIFGSHDMELHMDL